MHSVANKFGQRRAAIFSIIGLWVLSLAAPNLAEVPAETAWIDVRSSSEYATGHLQGAVNIPFSGIEKGVAGLQLERDAPIYLYCARGGRAEKARQRLLAAGYTQVVNVGGLEDAKSIAGQ